MKKKKILFLANPRSGSNRKRNLAKMLDDHLDHSIFDHQLIFTEYAGHAIELTKNAVAQNTDIVVACGGDGSVNEIAGQLIDTQTVLGVLPCGSGNGFAMHLGLGRNVEKAIRLLNTGKIITVDSCRMNEKVFVNLSGVGFDAVVAKRLHESKGRGFRAYFRYTLEEVLGYKLQRFDIQIDGQKISRECLLIAVANAPIYGYGFSIVPPAILNDGKLEVLLVNKAPKWRYFLEAWRFLNHSFHKSPLVECFTAKEVVITPSRATAVHVDGEGFDLAGKATFSIAPQSLKVIAPAKYAILLRDEG